jgi:hypothetical protein
MSDFGLAEVTLRAFTDPSKRVKELALEVFCAFTANEKLRPYLVDELKAVDELRRFAGDRNLYVWYAVSNLADHNEKVCAEIANDEYYMDSLLDCYEKSLRMQDMYYLRPIIRLLSNLALYPESCAKLSTTYKERLESLINVFIMPETQSMTNNINLRLRLSKNEPRVWPDLVTEMRDAGIHEEEKHSLEMFSMLHQGMAVGAVGLFWSLFRAFRLKGKHYPLLRHEREWIRKAVWTSPIAAILLSFTWFGTEKLSSFISDMSSWDSFRDARNAFLPNFLTLPIYWFALNYLGPFATLPSLLRIRYKETIPPYSYHLREPLMELFEATGMIDDRNFDPTEPERFTTNLGEIAMENQTIRRKLKEDAEWVAKQEQKKWYQFW